MPEGSSLAVARRTGQGRGRRRRLLFGGTVALAAGLTAASGALACTWFEGKMKVVGNALTVAAVAVGSGGSMSWCAGFPTGTAKATSGGTIKVVIKPRPAKCGSGKLPKGTYDINFVNGAAVSKDPRQWLIDCMSGLAAPGMVRLGGLFVNRYGLGGPKTFTLPANLIANGPNDESAVCISDAAGFQGNQVPLTII